MNTTLKYVDGEPVPFASYRCKATARKTKVTTITHGCRRHIDHDGDHKCICGLTWPHLDATGVGA